MKYVLVFLIALSHLKTFSVSENIGRPVKDLKTFSLSENVGKPVKKWAVTQTLLSNGEVRLMGCESILHKGLFNLENCETNFSSWLENFEFENVKSSSLHCVERPHGENNLYSCSIAYPQEYLLSGGELILFGTATGILAHSLTKGMRTAYGGPIFIGALVFMSVALLFTEQNYLNNHIQKNIMSMIHKDNLQVGRPIVFILDTERQQAGLLKFIQRVATADKQE